MALTLKIKSKGIFGRNKGINFGELLKNCGLDYGKYNEFHILVNREAEQNTAILFNPKRIGRGIFFDAGKANEGEITIRLNFPTTPSEIRDFVNVAKEIERQFGKAFLHSEEEDKGYTTASLESSIDDMIRFSLETLNRQCTENPDKQYILTLALFPWFVEKNKRAEYKECTSLDDFEEKMHSLQAGDYYYAKPSLFKDTNSGKNLAFYTLTDDCESVFPIHADDFLNMNDVKIHQGHIRFFLFEEKKVVDGIYPYDAFMDYVWKNVAPFDATHVIVPPMSKNEIFKFIETVKK